MANGHTLDKHVGKTDEQLAQRLRDQQSGGPTTAWPHGDAQRRDQWPQRELVAGAPQRPAVRVQAGRSECQAYDVSGVDTRIRYDSSRNPPFTVMTSMPSKS
ncbi:MULTISPECIES: RNase A-like domain-containing protein [Streptomyces]|uniref:RNase A-like domain-containing protein n=1 Tax=Streptomyces TaxID=1883 RepID=UPI0015CF3022